MDFPCIFSLITMRSYTQLKQGSHILLFKLPQQREQFMVSNELGSCNDRQKVIAGLQFMECIFR